MKGGNSGHNRSDLDKGYIIKPTFDTLTEDGHKTFEGYRTNLEEIFLSCCEVMRQGTILKDTTPIVCTKPDVVLEVRPKPSPSLNDVEHMANSALERQAKSTDELLCRLVEEQDRKKYDDSNVNPSSNSTVNFAQINPHTSGPSAGDASMPIPSAQPVNHFHSWTNIKCLSPNRGMPQ
jgi:hypothetical protein